MRALARRHRRAATGAVGDVLRDATARAEEATAASTHDFGAAGTSVKVFFLSCVLIAGVYGAMTASRKILFVQALPALIALVVLLLA